MKQFFAVAILCCASFLKPFAQANILLPVNSADSSAILYYDSAMNADMHLYNGREYATIGHNIKGFPYYEWDSLVKGSVFYDGNFYANIPMQYDLVNDALVITEYSGNYKIQLVPEKVSYFLLGSHRFINMLAIEDSATARTGFYEELYKGKSGVLARREKKSQVVGKVEDNEFRYAQYNTYYIEKDDKLLVVSNEKAVLKVFEKRADELKKFIHSNKLNFRKRFEASLVSVAAYYDALEK